MRHNEQWVAFSTLATKEIRRFMRIWPQTLLPPAITMTLYFVIFGKIVGSRIGEMGDFDYMQYIVPGLIMMSVIQNSYSNVVSSFFGAKFHHSVEELMVSPMSPFVVLCGYVAGGVVRGLLVAGIVTIIAMFFTDGLGIAYASLTFLVILLTAILFSLAGFINAVFANNFDDVSIVPTFVLTPLTYLGGVFYSIQLLPEFWQGVSKFNPVLYMVNSFRYGILGDHNTDVSVGISIFALIIFTAAMFAFAWWLLDRGTGIRH